MTYASPSFQVPIGWSYRDTGNVDPNDDVTPTAWASNVPFAPGDQVADGIPMNSIAVLFPGGMILVASLPVPDTSPCGANAQLPDVYPPFQLDDADVRVNWEGNPTSNTPEYLLTQHANSQVATARVYFGQNNPGSALISQAQSVLNTLVIPPP